MKLLVILLAIYALCCLALDRIRKRIEQTEYPECPLFYDEETHEHFYKWVLFVALFVDQFGQVYWLMSV